MEKQTDRLALNYFEKVYNCVYHTENNKELFNMFIPDGWLYSEDNHSLLIIENKQSVQQEKNALEQLQKYITVAKQNRKQPINIYCMFCSGINQEVFMVKYYNSDLQPMKEQEVVKVFKQQAKTNSSISPQVIHNMLVKNFHFDKPNELYDILLIIMLSFTDEQLTQYYKYTSQQVDKQFVNILCQNVLDTLGKQYEKYIEVIKHTEFTNVFSTCKTIYEAYNDNYNIVGSLLDQFKKYKQDYTTNKNEVWTEKDIATLMFNEVKPLCNYLVNKFGYFNVFDPCVGGGNLLKPFINEFNNKVKLYGCDILKHYTMLNKLELLINNIQGEFYNVDYMQVNNADLPQNVITICNPPYSKNISKYEAIEFLAKSSQHSLLCCYIFPLSQLRKPACKQYRDTILKHHDVIKVLNIGEIFKTCSTGDIAIVITIRKAKIYRPTKIYDLSLLSTSEYYKKVIRQSRYEFTTKGLQLLDDYKHNILTPETATLTTNSLAWVDNNNLSIDEERLKRELLNIELDKITKEITIAIHNDVTDLSIFNGNIKQAHDKVNAMTFKQVKLNELFAEVKCKKFTVSKTSKGDIPLYGATNTTEPLKHINDFSYSCHNGETVITINKDGSAGYCFRRSGTFALNSHVKLYKEKDKICLSDEDLYLISLQLNKLYSFSNSMTTDRFNNTVIFITC